MGFNEDNKINQYDLLDALLKQSQLFYEWSKRASDAEVETAEAKDRLEIVKGDVDLRIRRNPKRYKLPEGKNPEGAIKATVLKDKKVRRYTKEYFKALRSEKTLSDARRAFQQRKNMLESLTTLNIQLHFAEPRADGKPRGELSNRQAQEDIRSSLKKRKLKRRGK